MNRRSFFNSIAKAVAVVALAPQLCFRPRWEAPETVLSYRCNVMGIYEQLRMCGNAYELTPPPTVLDLLNNVYAVIKRRKQNQEWVDEFFRA